MMCVWSDKSIKSNSIDLRGQNSPSLSILFNVHSPFLLSSLSHSPSHTHVSHSLSLSLPLSLSCPPRFVFHFTSLSFFFSSFLLVFVFLFSPFSPLLSRFSFHPPYSSHRLLIFFSFFCHFYYFLTSLSSHFFYHHRSIPSISTLPFSSLTHLHDHTRPSFPAPHPPPPALWHRQLPSFFFPHQLSPIFLILLRPYHELHSRNRGTNICRYVLRLCFSFHFFLQAPSSTPRSSPLLPVTPFHLFSLSIPFLLSPFRFPFHFPLPFLQPVADLDPLVTTKQIPFFRHPLGVFLKPSVALLFTTLLLLLQFDSFTHLLETQLIFSELTSSVHSTA